MGAAGGMGNRGPGARLTEDLGANLLSLGEPAGAGRAR